MSAVREFLSKVLPWEQAGDSVFFNMHWRAPVSDPKPGRTHFWDGRAYSTLDELVNGVEFWAQSGNRDVYVCMSSQSRYETKNSKINKPYRKAIRFQANVVALKSFYVDIDVKPEAYPTQQEALNAFKLFIEASDMPTPSAVVGSGSGGFHAHWVVDRALSLSEWQPVANALAHACQTFGLICDTQCTIDSARILRVPGTKNYKSNPPTPVTLISSGEICSFEDIKETLAPYVGVTPVGNSETSTFPFERRRPTTEGSELGEGIEAYDAPAIKLERVAEVCPFIADAICDGGANYNNPLWYMTLQVASFTEEGREAAHLMSFQHPTYTEEETNNEYDRVARQHKEKNIGWPQCDKIKLSGATQCAACPLLASHKSPFNFVAAQAPALTAPSQVAPGTPPVDIWPDRYSKRPDGCIYISVVNEAGAITEQKICPYPIMHGWLQDNPWVLHFTALTSFGKQTKVEIPLEDFGAMGGTRKTLSQNGIVLGDATFKATQEFLLAWTQKLQAQKDRVVSSTPYGWVKYPNDDIEGFTYAGRVWGAGVDRPSAHDDKELYDVYSPHGSIDPWRDAVKIITDQQRPALECIVAGAFASPLMQFIGHDGLLLSAFSREPGIGKTSAMTAGLSVWADPSRGKQGLDDTGNSVFGKTEKLKVLPIYWDEMQEPQEVENGLKMVFKVTGGKGKSRMKQDRTLAHVGTWQTIMITTTNVSLVEAIQLRNKEHVAGVMRVLEFKVTKPKPGSAGQIETGKATRAFAKLRGNYGNAGLIYAQFLGAHHKRIAVEVAAINDRINKEVDVQNEERFWTSGIALLLAGAGYANELRLTNFNLKSMEEFLKETLREMRETVKGSASDMSNQSAVMSTLTQFLNAMRARNTLITNRIHSGAGKPVKGSIKILNDATKLDAIYVHIGRDDKLLRFSSTQLSEWMFNRDRKSTRQTFITALQEEFGFKKVYGQLCGGTHLSTGTKEYVYEISMTDPRLLGFLDADF